MSALSRPVPTMDDPDTAGFFEAAQRRELAICVCSRCDTVLHLPRAYCHRCGSFEVSWRTVRGRGRLYAWTVTERQLHPAFPGPQTVVLVELEDAPQVRLVGSVPGNPLLAAGQPMETIFVELPDGRLIPDWRPVDD